MGRDIYSVIKGKWNTFQKDPVGSAKAKARSYMRWLLNCWGERKLRQKGVLDALLNFIAGRPQNAIPADFADLWFLYRTVRRRKPGIIFEFGSGCSTVILAQALSDNQRNSSKSGGYLYSVDADPFWAQVTARSIPTRLREFCKISYSPLLEAEYKGILGFRHAHIPDVVPNFVYLDGPALTFERQVAIDVLDIEEKLPADFYMVIDGRKKNMLFLKNNLKRRYRYKERKLSFNYVFELVE